MAAGRPVSGAPAGAMPFFAAISKVGWGWLAGWIQPNRLAAMSSVLSGCAIAAIVYAAEAP